MMTINLTLPKVATEDIQLYVIGLGEFLGETATVKHSTGVYDIEIETESQLIEPKVRQFLKKNNVAVFMGVYK